MKKLQSFFVSDGGRGALVLAFLLGKLQRAEPSLLPLRLRLRLRLRVGLSSGFPPSRSEGSLLPAQPRPAQPLAPRPAAGRRGQGRAGQGWPFFALEFSSFPSWDGLRFPRPTTRACGSPTGGESPGGAQPAKGSAATTCLRILLGGESAVPREEALGGCFGGGYRRGPLLISPFFTPHQRSDLVSVKDTRPCLLRASCRTEGGTSAAFSLRAAPPSPLILSGCAK